MNPRVVSLSLASISSLFAQEPVPQPPLENAQDLRNVLEDRNGDLSALATRLLGKNGGNHLFYLPTRDEPTTPAKWGFDYEVVDFKSADGTSLHGWFLPGRAKQPKGTVVFSHGNGGSMSYHLGFVMWIAEAGYNVMMYDYRGFGKSGGVVDRRGMVDDVKAAFRYVSKRADVDPNRLISFGHSLGGAKSITALGETPVKGLRAIIIDGTFSSYQAMARVVGGEVGANLVSDEWAPKDFISKLQPVPLLVVHGTADEVVPIGQGRALFQAARLPKTFFEVENGHHGDSLSRNNGVYRKKMISWLDVTLNG